MNAFLTLWMLPQNVMGMLLCLMLGAVPAGNIWYTQRNVSITLGWFIIVGPGANQYTIDHELGHQKQSKILGPLYLLVIGVPSICRAALWTTCGFPRETYYKGFPESWADRLGNVKRG